MSNQPNIILINCDDLGYGDLGCNGHPWARTPHLDKLHSEAVALDDYHVAPTCSPTRCGLLTGHWTNRTGVWHTINGRSMLRENEVTLGQLLKDNGYATGMFGKWHMGDNYPYRPEDRGFNEVYRHGGGGVGQTPDVWDNSYFDGGYFHNQKIVQAKGFCTDVFFEQANKFITKNAKAKKPFFAYLPITIPHAALQCPEEDVAPFRKKFSQFEDKIGKYSHGTRVRNPVAAFAGMMTRMDRGIGEVLDLLDELKIADNTLVLFTSDNGPHYEGGHQPGFFNSNGPLKGHKRDLYEGGIRVPLIAYWPGRVKEGSVSEHICAHWDLMPTLCDLAGIDTPKHTDVISYVPTLTGGKQKAHEYLYWEFHAYGKTQAIRMGDWKAIRLKVAKDPNAPIRLYDLAKDIGETKDIAAQHPEVIKRIRPLFKSARVESDLFTLYPGKK